MPWVGFVPGIGIFTVFVLGPAIAIAVVSLTNLSGTPNVPWEWVGLDNYRRFFLGQWDDNARVLMRTLQFVLVLSVVQSAIALGIAVLLNGRLRGRTIVRSLVFLPTVLGVVVIALTFSLFFQPNRGPAASIVELFGVSTAFFGDPNISFALVIGVQMWTGMGYAMMILLAGLQTIPGELYEAARCDGAGAWTRFRHVTWPMIAPAITVNTLIAIIGSMQTYQLIYVLTGGRFETSVLALEVFTEAFGGDGSGGGSTRQGYAAALSMLQFFLVLIVSMVALRFLRRREVQL
ncbi:sugar ABC transporter permease [Ruania alkalisoli]|uniref:Sugar ABC transporter permease n=1 Tax=Ruania alkalisoli TaxID=2779775 RepID=A0A7M1SST7_9MICO|nr:sugar ABC transporter permease [Ruania alkalisoli]QOR70207.1 sugar ABC transporter permease [Ruania alkalisoli]